MAQNTKIEWCDHTNNLWHGCTKVTAGCDHCYAEALSHRYGNDVWGNDKPRQRIKSAFSDLAKFQKQAKAKDVIETVFVGSMMDIFEKSMPMIHTDFANTGHLRKLLFSNIRHTRYPSENLADSYYHYSYPNLVYLFLTKRPGNINKYSPKNWIDNPPKNVWFGTSPCDQPTFKTLVNQLLKVSGKRFLSIEPQIAMIDNIDLSGISWIIQGGESGHHKRPFKLEWARRMRDICKEQNVPYFFKQIDKIQPILKDLQIREYPEWS